MHKNYNHSLQAGILPGAVEKAEETKCKKYLQKLIE